MTFHRRAVYFNPAASSWRSSSTTDSTFHPHDFHKKLDGYQPTPLVPMQDVAKELGIGAIYIKDESDRFGLPAFKILGASWAVFNALCSELGLPLDTELEGVRARLAERPLALYAATDGNHGRAVARMAVLLSIRAQIHIPRGMHTETRRRIEVEGAEIVQSESDYDAAIMESKLAADQDPAGILVQDAAFEGYEDIPRWVVHGYSTMMAEIDQQLPANGPDFVISPVGVGSLAEATVTHFKDPSRSKPSAVVTVEPETAACLWKCLNQGKLTTKTPTHTIMAGLECGTPSLSAWPVLQQGVDASLTVSDYESHVACLDLKRHNVNGGPCGAAGLAALRRLTPSDRGALGLGPDSVVVLICTEGERQYDIPRDVSLNDPGQLTQALVQIDSSSPLLGSVPGPGETEIARFIAEWLEYRGIETHWIEPSPGRPSVIGVVRGSGAGKSLMLNGHIDTVTLQGYDGNALSGEIKGDKLFGRGAADMKSGLAAMMIALSNVSTLGLSGDVVFAGVADEEAESCGTEQILQAGWKTDAALVSEPTEMAIIRTHKGYVWLDVDFHGVASHGSRPDLGVDAICKAGHFLAELDRYSKELKTRTETPAVGHPSVHASLIKGGEEVSSYPARCTVTIERRTVPGETPESVRQEIEGILERLGGSVDDFAYDLRVTFSRQPFALDSDHPFLNLVKGEVGKVTGTEPVVQSVPFWTDAALLADAGIDPLIWGPNGYGLHSKEEYVEIESIRQVASGMTAIVKEFCK